MTVWVVPSLLVHVTVLFTPITTVIVPGWKAKPAIETATLPVAWLGATDDASAKAFSKYLLGDAAFVALLGIQVVLIAVGIVAFLMSRKTLAAAR